MTERSPRSPRLCDAIEKLLVFNVRRALPSLSGNPETASAIGFVGLGLAAIVSECDSEFRRTTDSVVLKTLNGMTESGEVNNRVSQGQKRRPNRIPERCLPMADRQTVQLFQKPILMTFHSEFNRSLIDGA